MPLLWDLTFVVIDLSRLQSKNSVTFYIQGEGGADRRSEGSALLFDTRIPQGNAGCVSNCQ